MMVKQQTGTGLMFTHYLQTCTYAYNSVANQALNGLSPFQLIYGGPPKVLLQRETNPHLDILKNIMSN